jgi:hypothetical protein
MVSLVGMTASKRVAEVFTVIFKQNILFLSVKVIFAELKD